MKAERMGGRKGKGDRNSEGVCGRDSREAQNTEIQVTKELILHQKQLFVVSYNFPFIEIQEGSYGEASFRDDDFPRCLMG